MEYCRDCVYRLNLVPVSWRCPEGTARFTYHNDRMCLTGKAFGASCPQVPEAVDEIGLSWYLEASSSELVHWIVVVPRSAEVDWTGLGSPDTWVPYRSRASEVIELPEVSTTDSPNFHLITMFCTHVGHYQPVLWVLW